MNGAARLAAAILVAGAMTVSADPVLLSFDDLEGWGGDDPAPALAAFQTTCAQLDPVDWDTVCSGADDAPSARAFFEAHFLPVLMAPTETALFTGYYEPEIVASRTRRAGFETPLYRAPPEMPRGRPWLTRAQIENERPLAGRGLEIAWVHDPVEAFFLQVQGSGRLQLQDGGVIRVGFAAKNGHPYRSVGQELIRRGLFEAHRVSAARIARWVASNPRDGKRLLQHNPSFIFFREVNEVPPEMGPLGAMNRSVTPGRSIAVDPAHVPLGAPVWIEKEGAAPIRRLMIAQDTGSAIKGPQRADIFFGTGDEAGRIAGRIRDGGRMVVLMPRPLALKVTGQAG
ncbi:MAG: membrane-bound lytic murein transglycosylase A [Dinoroseobacter sp.]|jgi:membrane-bound lytic murein transglycosylase A